VFAKPLDAGNDSTQWVDVGQVRRAVEPRRRTVGPPLDRRRRKGASGDAVESSTLDAAPGNTAIAREFVASRLSELDLESSVAVLLTSELVGNVVLHAQTDLTVVVEVEQFVRIEVHDGVAATDAFREIIASAPTDVPARSPSGRGLGLVRALASRFGLGDEPGQRNGKIVWFELDHGDLAIPGANHPPP
jgi:anti-sigma regulatory factor (Ser/Thr protein kinase)